MERGLTEAPVGETGVGLGVGADVIEGLEPSEGRLVNIFDVFGAMVYELKYEG